jgi:hypothetical protein
VPVGEAPRQQQRVDHAIQFGQQRPLHHPVFQTGHRQVPHSPALLGDVHRDHRVRLECAIGQFTGESADMPGGGGLEPVQLRAALTVGERGIPYLVPGVQQRLLGECPRHQLTHLRPR